MSTFPLISGAESLAASFHILIDEILMSGDAVVAEKTEKLAEMLRAAATARGGNASHEGLLLDSLLRDAQGNSRSDLGHLATIVVASRPIPNDALHALAEIAKRVSHERAALSTRTGSW